MKLTDRETATMLAALRHYQHNTEFDQRQEGSPEHFEDQEPLDDEEIDNLCEKINT